MIKSFQKKKQQFSIEEITEKIKYYCKYQERCCSEVKEKLYSFNISKAEVEDVLNEMIRQGYVDDKRFAVAFARGKFKLKKWGKQKIKNALKQKYISDECISQALNAIDKNEYKNVFYSLADKKLNSLTIVKSIYTKKRKVSDYLLQKGFDQQLVYEYVHSINS